MWYLIFFNDQLFFFEIKKQIFVDSSCKITANKPKPLILYLNLLCLNLLSIFPTLGSKSITLNFTDNVFAKKNGKLQNKIIFFFLIKGILKHVILLI